MQIAWKSDSKGRLLLGAAFTNMTFLVVEKETGPRPPSLRRHEPDSIEHPFDPAQQIFEACA